ALSTRGHSTACVQRPRSSVEAALDLGKASFVTRSANGSTASEADLVWNRWRSTRACVPIDALAGAPTVVLSRFVGGRRKPCGAMPGSDERTESRLYFTLCI